MVCLLEPLSKICHQHFLHLTDIVAHKNDFSSDLIFGRDFCISRYFFLFTHVYWCGNLCICVLVGFAVLPANGNMDNY